MRRVNLRGNGGGQKEATAETKLEVRDGNEPGRYLCVNFQVCDSAFAWVCLPQRVEELWRARGGTGYGRVGEIIIHNEQESGSSPLVNSFFLGLQNHRTLHT